ncbi:(2Fe-2S)-binding protein [Telmatospirillum sp.]|uniref:(2Fe-2S)-binding protein n=1 Tax=Telmatospirillum sp. TaxID=2079197 RepID=UPI00283DB1E1|nr:(2Fe-2S)-binding protein [Telmatospirillum sp.]MDR3436731.1 (2Fe-2S)-binding protein [Telmatospirillum sp.]
MYICVCNALTDGDVRNAEAAGAVTHGQVFRHYGVKPQCGRCLSCMRGAMGQQGGVASERRHADDAAPVAGHSRRLDR